MQMDKLTRTFSEQKVRAHVPTNDVTGPEYKPVYEQTKGRIETLFGKKSPKYWTAAPTSCSKCYSVTPGAASAGEQ